MADDSPAPREDSISGSDEPWGGLDGLDGFPGFEELWGFCGLELLEDVSEPDDIPPGAFWFSRGYLRCWDGVFICSTESKR